MCRRVTCRKCGRPSYEGCGRHVEMVLGNVPADERCTCPVKKQCCGGCHKEEDED